jgi:hypothetical protein
MRGSHSRRAGALDRHIAPLGFSLGNFLTFRLWVTQGRRDTVGADRLIKIELPVRSHNDVAPAVDFC